MKMNTDHPSFVILLDDIANKVFEKIDVSTYFILNNEKKAVIQKAVYSLIEKNVKSKVTLLNEQLKTFLIVLIRKNEKIERYEYSAVLNDIVNNFDVITNCSGKNIKCVNHETNMQ